MADQYRDMMSPLALKLSDAVLDIVGDSLSKEELQNWSLKLPEIKDVKEFAELCAGFVFSVPYKFEKHSPNPWHRMHAKAVAKEADAAKENAKIEAQLYRNHIEQ